MAANQTGLRRRFFTWETPLLGQAVEHLASSASAAGRGHGESEAVQPSIARALDLSAQLVVVPTRQAGRRLREALAVHAARQGTALFPPLVLTFDALLELLREASETSAGGEADAAAGLGQVRQASQLQVLLAWLDVLRGAELEAFRAVFPIAPPKQDFSWARGMAEQLASLQDELRENGLGLVEAAAQLARSEPDFPELERWQELADLERRQRARLAKCGVASPLEAQRELLARGRLPAGIERVLVCAWPDPRPMVLGFFERVAESLPVDVCVYASESEAANFDHWGRPIPEIWAAHELRLPDFEERVRVCADPHEQAERLAEVTALYYKREAAQEAAAGARPKFDDGSVTASVPALSAKADLRTSSDRVPNKELCDLALGVVDAEIFRPLETALRERGVPSYNPEGRERRGDRLHQLLSALADFAREDSFHVLARLARQPDVLCALCGNNAAVGAKFLAELDRVYEQHLPPDLGAVCAKWRSADAAGLAVLARLTEWREGREGLRRGEFPQNVQAVLAQIFQGRAFDLERADDAAWVAAAEVWAKCLREVVEAAPLCPALGGGGGDGRGSAGDDRRVNAAGDKCTGLVGEVGGALLELAIARYARERASAEKAPEAVELQGWLELIWEDAPHLLVAGLNEGKVPASVSGDLFLPESLRVKLGLKTNAQRFAVDAYYLQALAASRAGRCRSHSGDAVRCAPPLGGVAAAETLRTTDAGARIDVLLGRVSAKGDPLKPSRLLLRCADEALPERVQFLFREAAPRGGVNVAWARAWKLQLPDPSERELPPHLPVTGLSAWLKCPLRFYLSRVLKLRSVDAAKVEMDARDFGTLCHAALEAMGREACVDSGVRGSLTGCTDAGRLQRFLHAALDEAVARQFGRRLSVPLRVQVEAARQRLDALAVEQARQHAEGWRIKRVEWEFEVPIGELVFRGKIDRIDEHEASGALRVIDYKTSDKAEPPEKVHLVSPPRGEALPEWRLWSPEDAKKPRAWGDLQLPVYERVCAGEFPGRELRCAYFHLPRAVGDTRLSSWENYSSDLAASAWGCAEGVAAAIARREFWSPRELRGHDAERDEFATLFQRGAAESIGQWPFHSGAVPRAQTGAPPRLEEKAEAGRSVEQ